MTSYEFVQNLTETQGIGQYYIENGLDDALSFCQFYGDAHHCEGGSEGQCSDDGNLWGSDGAIALFCTNHAFPVGGYEFYAELMENAKEYALERVRIMRAEAKTE